MTDRRDFLRMLGAGAVVTGAGLLVPEPARRYWQVGRNAPVGELTFRRCAIQSGVPLHLQFQGTIKAAGPMTLTLPHGCSLVRYEGDSEHVIHVQGDDETRVVSASKVFLHWLSEKPTLTSQQVTSALQVREVPKPWEIVYE